LRVPWQSFSIAAECPFHPEFMADLDVMDGAFVLTVLSRGRDSPDDRADGW
jgi:hypothetical protein